MPKKRKEKVLSTKSSSAAGIFAGIAIVGALVALGGVGYLWNEARVEKAKLAFENNSLQSELNAQRTQMSTLQTSLESLQKELASAKDYAAKVESDNGMIGGRVSALEGQIAEMTGSSRIDWMLKEVEHFIMVAERRLSLLGDVDGALALMLEADQLVRDMAEPSARPLRTAVQKDLVALKASSDTSVDTEGLFAQIAILNSKVAELKSAAITYEVRMPVAATHETVPEDGFGYAMYEVRQFLKSLVRVQRVTEAEVKPLLLQDQQAYVEQNIQLLLEQAQLAMLRGDQAVYTASLKEAASRITSYLRTNTEASKSFVASLEQLSAVTVQPAVPSIEGSVRAVRVFRDFWQTEKVERQLGRAAIEVETKAAAVEPDAVPTLP